MPKKKHLVELSDEERDQLGQLIRRGKTSARTITRARILLHAAAGWTDDDIVCSLNVGIATVERVRKRFGQSGLETLKDRPRPGHRPKLDARAEARLIAEACSTAPEGRDRWTLELLAERVVALNLAESYSDESVRRVLKKTRSSRG